MPELYRAVIDTNYIMFALLAFDKWKGECHMATKDRRIVSDPQIMMGKPTIAGTRITVESIIKKLVAGENTEMIKER